MPRLILNSSKYWLKTVVQSSTRMSSNSHKTLFTDTGLIGDGSVALMVGAPAERHLEKVSKFIQKASQHCHNADWSLDCSYLQYGPKAGSPRYRQQVAKFLSEGYGSPVDSESLVVTSGATHGLHLVGSVLFSKGYTVFVEDPTYFIAINILKGELGMNVVSVPTGDGGVDLALLEKRLQELASSDDREVTSTHPFKSVIYLIPTYHNPLGHCMPSGNCKAVVQLARKYDALIFCDDVYNLLHFDENSHAPPRLLTYDDPKDADYKGGNVLSNGTFSKIMGPGLRLGWIEAGPRIVDRLRNNNIMWSAGSANQFTSEIVASALELNEGQTYLRGLNAEYKATVAAMGQAFKDNLPKNCSFTQPKGGYFIWITMPEGASAAVVAKAVLEKHKIKVLQGQICSGTGGSTNCIRISFSHYPEDVLVTSVTQLCDVITQHVNSL